MTTEQPHDFQDDSQAVGPGQLLRNAREQLGWTREQVASRIHLRLTLIAAIEADTYGKHTSHTFIRGYLRAYAKLVGIPEETILAAYDKLGLTPPDNIDMQSFSRRSRQQANDSRLKVVTWLVILVLIALSVAWWWQSTARRSAGPGRPGPSPPWRTSRKSTVRSIIDHRSRSVSSTSRGLALRRVTASLSVRRRNIRTTSPGWRRSR